MFGQGQGKHTCIHTHTKPWGEDVTAQHGEKKERNDNVATQYPEGNIMVREQKNNRCVQLRESPLINVATIAGRHYLVELACSHINTHSR